MYPGTTAGRRTTFWDSYTALSSVSIRARVEGLQMLVLERKSDPFKKGTRTRFVGSIQTAGQVPDLEPWGNFTRASILTPPPSTKLPLAYLGGMIRPAIGWSRVTTLAEVYGMPSKSSSWAVIFSAVAPSAARLTTLTFSGLHSRTVVNNE